MAPQNKLIKRHRLGYPPASLAVISATRYIVGGGGGKSKTGVPNRVTLMEYDGEKLSELSHVDFGDDRVMGLCALPSHKVVICTTAQGKTHEVAYGSKLELLSTTETAEVPDGEDNSPSQRAIGANPAGDTLLISQGSSVNVWAYKKGVKKPLTLVKGIKTHDIHSDDIRDVIYSPKDDVFLSCDDGILALWDVKKGEMITKARPSDSQSAATSPAKLKFRGALFSEDGQTIITAASGQKGGYLASRRLPSDKKGFSFSAAAAKDRLVTASPITSVDISPQKGPHLGVGTADGEVCVVDAGSLQCLCRLEAHGMPVTKVSVLPTGDCFSVAFDNNCALTLTRRHMITQSRRGYMVLFLLAFLLILAYILATGGGVFKRLL